MSIRLSEKNANLIDFTYLVFLVGWSLGNLFLLLKRYVFHVLLFYSANNTAFISDFINFYTIGKIVQIGQGLHAYDPNVQASVMESLIAPLHVSEVFYIQYVPFLFPLCTPLAAFPLETAYLLWVAISLTMAVAAGFVFHKFLPRFSSAKTTIAIFTGMFATLSALECLELGQLSLAILLFCAVYVSAVRTEKRNFAIDLFGGICLALLSIKPHYAILLAIPAFVLRRWRLLLVATIFEGLLLALAGATVGWSNVMNYPSIVLAADTNPKYGGVHPEHMVCLRGFLHGFVPDALALKACLVSTLAALATLTAMWCKDRLDSFKWNRLLAMTVTAMLVVSPHTNLYDCLLLVVPAYLLLSAVKLKGITALRTSSLKLQSALLILYPAFSAIIFCCWEFVRGINQTPIPFFLYHCAILAAIARTPAEPPTP